MKSLVVFYSWTGNTRKIAETIAKALKSDMEEIQDVKARKGVFGFMKSGFESLFKKLPKIKETKYSPEDYDLVIFGSPIWAGTIASPLRTYIAKNKDKIKKTALVIISGGDNPAKSANAVEEITKKKLVSVLGVVEEEIKGNKYEEKVKKFIEELKH